MKKDSKLKSFVEAVFNIVIGFSINFFANMLILPIFGLHASTETYFMIGLIYTTISIARSYILRRLFVNGFYESMKKWILTIYQRK